VSNPRFIVAVMLDEPAGKYYGGDVGAPVFSTVMGAALRMMAVPPDAPHSMNLHAARTGSEG
jgi:cell division protein FtsI (penicillin-binding protein 3)